MGTKGLPWGSIQRIQQKNPLALFLVVISGKE